MESEKKLRYDSCDDIKNSVGDGNEEEEDFSRVFHTGWYLRG
jgi:hypothetical protein